MISLEYTNVNHFYTTISGTNRKLSKIFHPHSRTYVRIKPCNLRTFMLKYGQIE